MNEILSSAEFDAMLDQARDGIHRLDLEHPGDAFLQSISRQLAFVFESTRGGKRPTGEQIKRLSFGVMASRALDELDPELAQALYRLACHLDRGSR